MKRIDKLYNNLEDEIVRLVSKHEDILKSVLNYLNEEDTDDGN